MPQVQATDKSTKATHNALARLGAECLIIGLGETLDGELKPHILMVNKPHKSASFYELPGGGLVPGTNPLDISSRKASLLTKLRKKTGTEEATHDAYGTLGSNVGLLTNITDLGYGVFYGESMDKNAKFDASYYYLFSAIYSAPITDFDVYARFNNDYNSYLAWFDVEALDTNTEFQRRYEELLPLINQVISTNSAKLEKIKSDIQDNIISFKKKVDDDTDTDLPVASNESFSDI